jgi:hypothetical protein
VQTAQTKKDITKKKDKTMTRETNETKCNQCKKYHRTFNSCLLPKTIDCYGPYSKWPTVGGFTRNEAAAVSAALETYLRAIGKSDCEKDVKVVDLLRSADKKLYESYD